MSVATIQRPAGALGGGLVGGLSSAAWDRIAGRAFYSTAAWLHLCDLHGGGEQDAAVAYADGEPTAAVPFTALSGPPSSLYRWNEQLEHRGLRRLADGGLLVGPRQGYRTELLVAPGHDRTDGVAGVVGALRDRSRACVGAGGGRACVAMYVPSVDARALVASGVDAPPVLLEADACFELPPGGWDGWVASLPSKRRVSVRREARRFREAGYTIERVGLAECYERLPPLADGTQSKYGDGAAAAVWLGFLEMHVAAMGAAAEVALCRDRTGELVGFCLYYVWGETLFLRWVGFDYSRVVGAAEYFNLTYYSQIALAAERGVRRIHAGIKAVEAKALRGARLSPLWLVDLAEDSPLASCRDAVRAHNSRVYERLGADSRTRGALGDADDWSVGQ